MESVFAVPLNYEGNHFGVLALYSNRASAFQTDERRALGEAARNVALAIHAAEARVELQERTRALKRQHDRLEEFARVISHELRHPLQVAMGRLEIVDADPERLRHLFETVFRFAVERSGDQTTLGIERLEDGPGFAITSTSGALPDANPEDLFQMHPEPSDARRISMRIIMNIIQSHDWDFTVVSMGDRTRFEFTEVTFI